MSNFASWYCKKYDQYFGEHPDVLLAQIYILVKKRSRMIAIYKEKGWAYKKVFIDIKDVRRFEMPAAKRN